MLECELTPTRFESHQAHIERRKRMASKAVPDVPIDLKRKGKVISPEIQKNEPEPSPVEIEPVPPSVPDPLTLPRDWLQVATLTSKADRLPPNMVQHIRRTVAREFGVTLAELDCQRRSKEFIAPRHVAMYLCKEMTLKSLAEIGRKFGGRDHTTVLNACRKMPGRMKQSPELCSQVVELQAKLEADIARWREMA